MADVNLLQELRDIHMPDGISAWPPGPGYIALLAMLIIALLGVTKYLFLKRKKTLLRIALAALDKLEAQSQSLSRAEQAAQITTILKRVALAYHPRTEVAALHGEAWFQFLNTTSKRSDFKRAKKALTEAPFDPNTKLPLDTLMTEARVWIKERGGLRV